MRILAAGWHGQIASAFMQIAPQRKDISAFAIGRPALIFANPEAWKERWETSGPMF